MGNPWLGRRVLAYAHQGGSLEAPSSTLFALEQALRSGATAIELDVHQSADGELFVIHDPTLDRTTDRAGAVADLCADDVREADAAYWFVPGRGAVHDLEATAYPFRGRAPADGAFRVALLEEVLARFDGVLLNLDIKRGLPEVPAYEGAVAAALRRHARLDDVIVTSFNDASTATFHALAPGIGTAPGASALTTIVQSIRRGDAVPAGLLQGHVALQVPHRVGAVRLVDEVLVSRAHEMGLALHVWTVDDPEEIRQLVRLGVDGVMSDVPSVLSAVLTAEGANYE